jgi:hypothetical protein
MINANDNQEMFHGMNVTCDHCGYWIAQQQLGGRRCVHGNDCPHQQKVIDEQKNGGNHKDA